MSSYLRDFCFQGLASEVYSSHGQTRFYTHKSAPCGFSASISGVQQRTLFKSWFRPRESISNHNIYPIVRDAHQDEWCEPITDPEQVRRRLEKQIKDYQRDYDAAFDAYVARVNSLKIYFNSIVERTQKSEDLSTHLSLEVEGLGVFSGAYTPNQPPGAFDIVIGGERIILPHRQIYSGTVELEGIGLVNIDFRPHLSDAKAWSALKDKWAKTGGSSWMKCPDSLSDDGLHNGHKTVGGDLEDFEREFIHLAAHKAARKGWEIPAANL